MQNVNITCKTYVVVGRINGIMRYKCPFDTIIGEYKNGKFKINKFYIVTDFHFMSTNHKKTKECSLVENKIGLNVIIRLDNFNDDHHISIPLDSFSIKVNDSDVHNFSIPCFISQKISEINLGKKAEKLSPGNYEIKVFIQREDRDEDSKQRYVLQTIIPFNIIVKS